MWNLLEIPRRRSSSRRHTPNNDDTRRILHSATRHLSSSSCTVTHSNRLLLSVGDTRRILLLADDPTHGSFSLLLIRHTDSSCLIRHVRSIGMQPIPSLSPLALIVADPPFSAAISSIDRSRQQSRSLLSIVLGNNLQIVAIVIPGIISINVG